MFDTRLLEKMNQKRKLIGDAIRLDCTQIGSYDIYEDRDVNTDDLYAIHKVNKALNDAVQAMTEVLDKFSIYSDNEEFIMQQKELYEMKMRDEL